MTTALMASSAPVKHVLMDASSINFIDTSGCDALLHIIKDLQGRGVSFAFARVRDEVREPMRLGGIESLLGPGNFYERLTDGVLAWQQHRNWLAPMR
jgi:anti-anti-sigma factor